MNVRRSVRFIADIERQYEWYATHAGWEIAERYLEAVEATIRLLEKHPRLGPLGGFAHPRLKSWRFFVVFRPFNKHLVFYEMTENDILMRRSMHGHRDLPKRLLD